MGGRGGQFNRSNPFSPSQADAVEHYVSGEGMWINQYLRNDGEGFGELSENERLYVSNLDSAVNKVLPEQVLYRSIDAGVIFGNMDDLMFSNLEGALLYGDKSKFAIQALEQAQRSIGKTIVDKGYQSTTRDAAIAEEFRGFTGASKPMVIRIKTSKGTKGANVSSIGDRYGDAQRETLLARNQGYRITRIYGKNGNVYADVEMK